MKGGGGVEGEGEAKTSLFHVVVFFPQWTKIEYFKIKIVRG